MYLFIPYTDIDIDIWLSTSNKRWYGAIVQFHESGTDLNRNQIIIYPRTSIQTLWKKKILICLEKKLIYFCFLNKKEITDARMIVTKNNDIEAIVVHIWKKKRTFCIMLYPNWLVKKYKTYKTYNPHIKIIYFCTFPIYKNNNKKYSKLLNYFFISDILIKFSFLKIILILTSKILQHFHNTFFWNNIYNDCQK